MRTLVAYMSKTGNARKVAEAVYEALDCEKEIMPIDHVVDVGGYDLSFLGFPVRRFGPDPKAVGFLRRHCQPGRDVALFVTHAAPEDAAELPGWLEGFRNVAASANLVGCSTVGGSSATGLRSSCRSYQTERYAPWPGETTARASPTPCGWTGRGHMPGRR